MKRLFLAFLLCAVFSTLTACGQKGDLYLPKKDTPKETDY